MILRKLTETDYPAVLEQYRELDELHVNARPDYFLTRKKEDVFPKEHFVHALEDPDCLLMGAFDGQGRITGTIRATLWQQSGMVKDLKTVCLDDIYVLPEYRRQGIATGLYQAVEQWAREQEANRIDLHVWSFNADALALYRTWGMTPQRYVLEKKL